MASLADDYEGEPLLLLLVSARCGHQTFLRLKTGRLKYLTFASSKQPANGMCHLLPFILFYFFPVYFELLTMLLGVEFIRVKCGIDCNSIPILGMYACVALW